MGSHMLLLLFYIRMGVCNLCYAFHNSPWPCCSILELNCFSKVEIRSFSKASDRLSSTWNTSLLNLLLVYRVARQQFLQNYNTNTNTKLYYNYSLVLNY